jgi:hypothetical protein
MVVKARISGLAEVLIGGISTNQLGLLQASDSHAEGSDHTGGFEATDVTNNEFFSTTRSVVVIYDGATSTIHVSQNSVSGTGTVVADQISQMLLGTYFDHASFPFDGEHADIAIWSRALGINEVQSLNTYAASRYGLTIKA